MRSEIVHFDFSSAIAVIVPFSRSRTIRKVSMSTLWSRRANSSFSSGSGISSGGGDRLFAELSFVNYKNMISIRRRKITERFKSLTITYCAEFILAYLRTLKPRS